MNYINLNRVEILGFWSDFWKSNTYNILGDLFPSTGLFILPMLYALLILSWFLGAGQVAWQSGGPLGRAQGCAISRAEFHEGRMYEKQTAKNYGIVA